MPRWAAAGFGRPPFGRASLLIVWVIWLNLLSRWAAAGFGRPPFGRASLLIVSRHFGSRFKVAQTAAGTVRDRCGDCFAREPRTNVCTSNAQRSHVACLWSVCAFACNCQRHQFPGGRFAEELCIALSVLSACCACFRKNTVPAQSRTVPITVPIAVPIACLRQKLPTRCLQGKHSLHMFFLVNI